MKLNEKQKERMYLDFLLKEQGDDYLHLAKIKEISNWFSDYFENLSLDNGYDFPGPMNQDIIIDSFTDTNTPKEEKRQNKILPPCTEHRYRTSVNPNLPLFCEYCTKPYVPTPQAQPIELIEELRHDSDFISQIVDVTNKSNEHTKIINHLTTIVKGK